MKKNVFIYIGAQKTGTTAVINFLHRNRNLLESRGHLFPHPWFEINPAQMVFVNEFTRPKFPNLENPKAFEVPSKVTLHAYRSRIGRSRADNVLFAGRFFSYRAMPAIERIKAFFADCLVTIVVYLRRQDLFVEAYYDQLLKRTLPGAGSFRQFIETPALDDWLDYSASLRPWVDAFGAENVRIRPYEAEQLPRGTIDDFADVIGLSKWSGLKIPDQQNEINLRLPPAILNFLELVKRQPLDPALRNQIENWAASAAKRFPDERRVARFKPGERIAYMQKFEDGNRKIARDFMGRSDGRLFWADPSNEDARAVCADEALTSRETDELLADLISFVGNADVRRPVTNVAELIRSSKISFMKHRWRVK